MGLAAAYEWRAIGYDGADRSMDIKRKVTEGNLALKGRGRIIKALFIVYWLRGGCIISGFAFPDMVSQSSVPPQ